MAPTPDLTPDLTREELALDKLLTALIAHREARKAQPRFSPRIGASPWAGRPLPTRAEAELSHLLDDPVGAALRQGIRRIGEHLFSHAQDTDALRDVLDRAAEMDSAVYGRRAVILNSAWDGIGRDGDRWAA